VTDDTVLAAIQTLQAHGTAPSVRNVYALTGGDYREVQRSLQRWRAEHGVMYGHVQPGNSSTGPVAAPGPDALQTLRQEAAQLLATMTRYGSPTNPTADSTAILELLVKVLDVLGRPGTP
jgi:hypothetical protein